MRGAFTIAAKDLKLRIRDRSVFIVGILAPLGLAFIFDLIIGPLAEQEFVPEFAVVDQDQGEPAQALEGLFTSIAAEGVIDVATGLASDVAEQQVDNGELAAAIIIAPGFSDSVMSANPASVQLIANVESPTSVGIARAIIEGFSAEVETVQLSVGTAVAASPAPPDPAELAFMAAEAAQVPALVEVDEAAAATRQLTLPTFFVAGMAAMFVFFTVQFGVLSLLEERKDGTMARLLAAPIRQLSVVAGKGLVSFLLGVVSMGVLVVASTFLLGAEWGNPWGVAVLVIALVFSALGIMAVVAAFSKTSEQAGNLQAMIAVALAMIGGIFFPSSLGTGFLARLAYLSPHRWFLTGLSDLAGGDGIGVIWPSVVALLAFAIATGGPALLRLRRGMMA